MREIKFRAWDKNDHEMKGVTLFGNLYLWTDDTWMDMADPKLVETAHEIGETCEIMQFTGLHDKDGKEIYEGDIVSPHDSLSYTYEVRFGEWGRMADCHGDSFYGVGWYLLDINDGDEFDSYSFGDGHEADDYIVVGNIYENPELLKESPGTT